MLEIRLSEQPVHDSEAQNVGSFTLPPNHDGIVLFVGVANNHLLDVGLGADDPTVAAALDPVRNLGSVNQTVFSSRPRLGVGAATRGSYLWVKKNIRSFSNLIELTMKNSITQ